ncbi:MAG: hypothetical protein P3A31_08660 [Gemmatimonadota bacterium]|nr:hypothetical protein [Gemmatimonadota bacterium]
MTSPVGLRALRALAVLAVLAMALDLPLGPAVPVAPWVGLDVSASWRTQDTSAWREAVRLVDSVRAAGADSLLLVGDSVRTGEIPVAPSDRASRVAPLVDAAIALGRPVVLLTDGRLDDPERLTRLPAGSVVRVIETAAAPDAAIAALTAPGGALGGDTIDVGVVVRAGAAGSGPRTLALRLGDRVVGTAAIPLLDAYAEHAVTLPVAVPAGDGATTLGASLESTAEDRVPANDAVRSPLLVSGAIAAVFVSTAPDQDARYLLAALRSTRRGPVQGFWRVAPGEWRTDGAMRPVPEAAVREAMRAAPMAVVHGDTALFGAPREVTTGRLVLVAPPPPGEDQYPVGVGESPIVAALTGIPWDSLPPLDVAATREEGFAAVRSRRARRFDERVVVRLVDGPRRIAIVPAAGFGRWRLRGGRSAEAFDALWGSVFDWVGADTATGAAIGPVAAADRAELVPRRPTVVEGMVGDGRPMASAPRAGTAWWLAAIAVLALCAEWIWRRRVGLR